MNTAINSAQVFIKLFLISDKVVATVSTCNR